jgi:hypothetical protein
MRVYNNEDAEYASTRLRGTVVMLNARPVEVLAMSPNSRSEVRCDLKDIITGDMIRADMQQLDITPVPLGYVNYNDQASYLTRMPTRGHGCQQGLRYATIRTINGMHAGDLPMSVIGKTIINDFPSLESCIKAVAKKHSQAFHRNWMIDSGLNLIYKGTEVAGRVLEGRCILDEAYSYLQEQLDDDMQSVHHRR